MSVCLFLSLSLLICTCSLNADAESLCTVCSEYDQRRALHPLSASNVEMGG
jgi:hypothetical protein